MNLTRWFLWTATSLSMASAHAGSDVVLIDHMEKAYTVYAGLPLDRAEAAKSKLEGKPVEMVPFEKFAENQKKIIGDRIVRNDYPGSRAEEGIVALIDKYPGTPFGVTWNGGIALTRNDYQVAKKAYEAFNSPEGFAKPELANDPVAPINHLKPLLGW